MSYLLALLIVNLFRMGLMRLLPLALGLATVGLGFTSCGVSFGINIIGDDSTKSVLTPETLRRFQEVARTSEPPEWCKSNESSTLTESVQYTSCYFYQATKKGIREYQVITCGYNSENEKLGLGPNNNCEDEVKKEHITSFDAGKYRRYFGKEKLMPAEIQLADQKQFAETLGFFLILFGLVLSLTGVVFLLKRRTVE